MKPTLLISFACLALTTLVLGACDSVTSSDLDDPVVVEAFLYAGEPVDDVRLTRTISLNSGDTVAASIDDAAVRLIKDDVAYVLVSTGSDGYYSYPGTDLTIATGDVFRLEVDYGDQHITAATTVPEPPVSIALSGTSLSVVVFEEPGTGGFPGGGFGGGPGRIMENTLTVTWNNPSEKLHYVVVESLETEDPDYILPEFIRERFTGFRLITQPTSANYYDVNTASLEVLGTHRAIVYRVNDEYGNLYENREQDSRDLNEPPTNIEGGLGVFSAFNSSSVTFEVVPADEE